MPLIDEQGNLFGVVNVIDALALLLVVAVVIAGASLVTSTGGTGPAPTTSPTSGTPNPATPSENVTRYVTVELGSQPAYVASQISDGDVVGHSGTGDVTVSDVYAVPSGDGRSIVTVRARVEGELVGPSGNRTFRFSNRVLRPGVGLSLETGDYRAEGRIVSLDEAGESVATTVATAEVTLANVRPAVADAISEGMEGGGAGSSPVRVVDEHVEPGVLVVTDADGEVHERDHPRRRTVTLTVELTVRETAAGLRYQGLRLNIGQTVVLDLESVVVEGTVTDLEVGDD